MLAAQQQSSQGTDAPNGAFQPLLRTRNVSRYFGGIAALMGVDIEARASEVVGLVGQNGAGKTTLLNVISGIYPPTSGGVYFAGKPIHGLMPHQIARRGIARTFQLTRGFGALPVEENVLVGALFGFGATPDIKKARARAWEVLEQVGLDHRRTAKPRELTLADRKRLELARAVAAQPRLLLLDEVAAGLNPTETQTMMRSLRKIRERGTTIIVVEHVLQVILDFADRIYVLDQARVIAEGKPKEVLSDARVVEAFIGAGLEGS